MRINKNYEAELNLKDFLFHILYKWRIILLIGLIAAAVFGFKEYWSFEKYHRAGEPAPSEVQWEDNVAANQKALERAELDVAAYDELIDSLTNYRETSLLMKMDPKNIWTAEKKYYLDAEDTVMDSVSESILFDTTTKILTTLSEAFSEDIDSASLIKVFGTDDWKDISEIASISVDRIQNTISVVGCGSTEEEAVQRKEFVDSYLTAASEKLAKTEKYRLDLLSDHVGTKAVLTAKDVNGEKEEKDLAFIQDTVNEDIKLYQSQQQPYINNRNSLKSVILIKPEPKTKEQAIFGFLLGAFITMGICAAFYLFNGRLKTSREMKNRYDISLLGEFIHSRAWWKGKGIDWLLEKLEFGKKTDIENELDHIASLIDAEKIGREILLTGSLEEKELKKIYDGLASKLQEKGIQLTLQPEYLRNNKAVTASGNGGAVLLVEEKYKSRVRDLNRMAEMLTIRNAKVIGAILL